MNDRNLLTSTSGLNVDLKTHVSLLTSFGYRPVVAVHGVVLNRHGAPRRRKNEPTLLQRDDIECVVARQRSAAITISNAIGNKGGR